MLSIARANRDQEAKMADKPGGPDQKRAAIREGHREGKSASEAGASTGASKQVKTKRTHDREPKGDRKS
jgi:hypothetical protein